MSVPQSRTNQRSTEGSVTNLYRNLNTTTVNQVLGLPGLFSTFTAPELKKLRIIAITSSVASMVAGIVGLFYLAGIDRRRRVFRHHLLLYLIVCDLLKAMVLMIYPVVILVRNEVYGTPGFYNTMGWFTAYAIEGADVAIVIFAVHFALLIFRPSWKWRNTRTGNMEGGLYRWRALIYPLTALLPLLLASLAFIDYRSMNKEVIKSNTNVVQDNNNYGFAIQPRKGGYKPLSAWCYLPPWPYWYRLVLSWGPRYFIMVSIFGIYVAIYLYVTNQSMKIKSEIGDFRERKPKFDIRRSRDSNGVPLSVRQRALTFVRFCSYKVGLTKLLSSLKGFFFFPLEDYREKHGSSSSGGGGSSSGSSDGSKDTVAEKTAVPFGGRFSHSAHSMILDDAYSHGHGHSSGDTRFPKHGGADHRFKKFDEESTFNDSTDIYKDGSFDLSAMEKSDKLHDLRRSTKEKQLQSQHTSAKSSRRSSNRTAVDPRESANNVFASLSDVSSRRRSVQQSPRGAKMGSLQGPGDAVDELVPVQSAGTRNPQAGVTRSSAGEPILSLKDSKFGSSASNQGRINPPAPSHAAETNGSSDTKEANRGNDNDNNDTNNNSNSNGREHNGDHGDHGVGASANEAQYTAGQDPSSRTRTLHRDPNSSDSGGGGGGGGSAGVDSEHITNVKKSFQSQTYLDFKERRTQIKRQLKSIFVYPFSYIVIWTFPLVVDITQYQYEVLHGPVVWLAYIATFMQPLSCVIDVLVFLYREKPWKHSWASIESKELIGKYMLKGEIGERDILAMCHSPWGRKGWYYRGRWAKQECWRHKPQRWKRFLWYVYRSAKGFMINSYDFEDTCNDAAYWDNYYSCGRSSECKTLSTSYENKAGTRIANSNRNDSSYSTCTDADPSSGAEVVHVPFRWRVVHSLPMLRGIDLDELDRHLHLKSKQDDVVIPGLHQALNLNHTSCQPPGRYFKPGYNLSSSSMNKQRCSGDSSAGPHTGRSSKRPSQASPSPLETPEAPDVEPAFQISLSANMDFGDIIKAGASNTSQNIGKPQKSDKNTGLDEEMGFLDFLKN